jgi:predicted RNase H-like HicB family nuclease
VADGSPPTVKVMKSRALKNFSYSVYYQQAPEGGYVAFVPALPGCHTQGETLEETERNVKGAIALYLKSLPEVATSRIRGWRIYWHAQSCVTGRARAIENRLT